MKKIISLFARNYDGDHLVRNEVVPGAEWVIAGEGIATRKWDGTCCMVRGGKLYKRYDAKTFTIDKRTSEKQPYNRPLPEGFEPAQELDPITGHWPGWLPVDGQKKEDQWHQEAWHCLEYLRDGTYELVGPKIGGNPEHADVHMLIPHGQHTHSDCPRDFDGIREYLRDKDIEGIVWWHPDGRMVKIKGKDFGFKRGVKCLETSSSNS